MQRLSDANQPIVTTRCRRKLSISWMLVVLCAIGCADQSGLPELGKVQGRVTLDGQPLADVGVIFTPENGRASRARTDANGNYELNYLRDIRGAVLGTHTVAIVSVVEVPDQNVVPSQYGRQSELKREVQPGDNQFNFELKSGPEGG